ncbi:unnamed protein product [Notodromas monacha]|uniref:Uncharacterized protein n=1 Tax=Notodromas monacha TaxID=399045 RepID=A0A7R9BST2_9CRUS|nr:unnamed protein product [Notodromas monacha]CAG0921083.1 unnamed protein product [Notodromas monacha]
MMIAKSFTTARFLGNTSVASIGFSPTNGFLKTWNDMPIIECLASCIAYTDCNSVNWAKNDASALIGRCEIINATSWKPISFLARPAEFSEFYVDVNMKSMTRLVAIPAVTSSTALAVSDPKAKWPTDCMFVSGSTAGFIVGFRNNQTSSSYIEHFKCRVFRHGFAMSAETPTVIAYSQYANFNLTCPSGWVITAALEDDSGFILTNNIRCMKPALPWFVNGAQCRTKALKTFKAAATPSPMKTTNFDGVNAEPDWGAQCGNSTTIEALVAYNFVLAPEWVLDTMLCCLLERAA